MKHPIKNCVVATLSGLLIFSLSGGVWAGGDHYNRGYRDSGYSHHGNWQGHVKPRHKYKVRHHSRYKNRHYDNDDQLFIGLLVGGLLGYAVGNSQDREVSAYYPPAAAQPAPNPVYYPTSSANSAIQYDTCLQEREYQTTVTIGGRPVQAYGTACLQPDGSWRRGPAQTANY